jgi:hypothetical protein
MSDICDTYTEFQYEDDPPAAMCQEIRRLRAVVVEQEREIEKWQTASGLCAPAEELGGDPGGVTPAHLANHIKELLECIDKLNRQAVAAETRVEELEASLVEIEKPGEKWWSCLIGPWKESVKSLPPGSDVPLRSAVEQAFLDHYGREGEICFSGWGAAPTANEHAGRNNEEVSDE